MSDDRSPISGIQVAPSEDGSQITILFYGALDAPPSAGVSLTPEVCEVLARDLADASKNCIELKKRTRH